VSGWSEQTPLDSLGSYGEFWKAKLNAGDKLTINATVAPACGGLVFSFYPPSVNDATVRTTNPSQTLAFNPTGAGTFVAPYAGNWTIFVNACSTTSYNFTASLPHRTATHPTHAGLTGPRKVRLHRRFTLNGRITGLSAGMVTIELLVNTEWRSVAKVRIGSDGSFHWQTRSTTRGLVRYRVVFTGNASHSRSQASHSVLVV
jgi:hypothetical protein